MCVDHVFASVHRHHICAATCILICRYSHRPTLHNTKTKTKTSPQTKTHDPAADISAHLHSARARHDCPRGVGRHEFYFSGYAKKQKQKQN